MRIFLAGATGAIGRRLVPLLLNAGYHVVGTTRSTTKEDALRSAGVEPVVVDVFDAPALSRAVLAARPDIVIDQLTDLPPGIDPSRMAEATRRTDRIREQGTENLVAAALASGATDWSRKASPGCTLRHRSRIPKVTRSISTRRESGRSRGGPRRSGAADPFVAANRRRRASLRTSLRSGHGSRPGRRGAITAC